MPIVERVWIELAHPDAWSLEKGPNSQGLRSPERRHLETPCFQRPEAKTAELRIGKDSFQA